MGSRPPCALLSFARTSPSGWIGCHIRLLTVSYLRSAGLRSPVRSFVSLRTVLYGAPGAPGATCGSGVSVSMAWLNVCLPGRATELGAVVALLWRGYCKKLRRGKSKPPPCQLICLPEPAPGACWSAALTLSLRRAGARRQRRAGRARRGGRGRGPDRSELKARPLRFSSGAAHYLFAAAPAGSACCGGRLWSGKAASSRRWQAAVDCQSSRMEPTTQIYSPALEMPS